MQGAGTDPVVLPPSFPLLHRHLWCRFFPFPPPKALDHPYVFAVLFSVLSPARQRCQTGPAPMARWHQDSHPPGQAGSLSCPKPAPGLEMPFVLLMGAGASPISWQTQVTPCRGVLDAGGTFGSPAGSKAGAAFPEAVWGSPQDPFLSCFTWEWLSSTLQAQPCSQPPCQQLLPTLGCFPPLLLFGSRELFWSWGVNTEAGPTAGRSDTGQVVSSVRAEISGGSRVLLPPENMSLGSRCSARGRGSMGGLPRCRAHVPGWDKLEAKQGFHNPLGFSSFRRANSKPPAGFASDLTSLTEAFLQK